MSRRRPQRRDPVAIGELLPRILDDFGLDTSTRVLRIAQRWDEAVGAEIAGHSRPLALRGEELDVGVESSVWCQQLQLLVPEMLAGLQRVHGDDAPSKLRLRMARVDER